MEKRKHPIRVVDYGPGWAETFKTLRAQIWPVVSDIAQSLEHVGSTSVVGLAAKPIIDMNIIVPTASDIPTIIERIVSLGYLHQGDQGIDGRESFKRPKGSPAHNLYTCAADNLGLRNHLVLRDHLRSHPEDVEAYGNLKKELPARHPDDIDAYVDGKTDLILGILERAGLSQSELDEIRGANELD